MEKQPDTIGTPGEHGIERASSATVHVTHTAQTDTIRSDRLWVSALHEYNDPFYATHDPGQWPDNDCYVRASPELLALIEEAKLYGRLRDAIGTGRLNEAALVFYDATR